MEIARGSVRDVRWRVLVLSLFGTFWAMTAALAAQPAGGPAAPGELEGMAWVRVSYGRLLDDAALVRTGQPLTSAVRDPAQRGAVQPFVDSYASLLQHAVQIINGPDSLPYTSVTDHYEPGAPQPAWVAIFRGGRIGAFADGKDRVRLFLQGTEPETAYDEHYSVVRHCLNALLPRDGKPLNIEVYAYQHDYAVSELRLNTRCGQLSGTSFPPKGKALDLMGLSTFLAQGAVLEGAHLSRSEGLVLYGKSGERPTLCGQLVSLADLAVAYRAVFHAGDNAAFVSLDEHPDPTKVMVNFGGFLEDTRIGSVVLEADKRFKTISSGIDPDSQEDIRGRTRRSVPSFLTVAERDLGAGSRMAGEWAATRLWFYPDQAGVETERDYEFAAITRPQFTADAERSGKAFVQPEGQAGGSGLTSPGIRESLSHLNARYDEYADAFPELRELSTVARLMAIASWLRHADPEWLDLDALLAVELPAHRTERERTNLLVATVRESSGAAGRDGTDSTTDARLVCFTPVLDRSVKEYFRTPERLAAYLSARGDASQVASGVVAAEILAEHGAAPVRSLIRNRRDLRALVDDALEVEHAGSVGILQEDIEAGDRRLDTLQAEIAAVKSECERASGVQYNRLVEKHNALLEQYRAELEAQRARVSRYNAGQVGGTAMMEIAGGIDLDWRSFQVLTPEQSARVAELRAMAEEVGEAGLAAWLRSQAAEVPLPPEIAALPESEWLVKLREDPKGVLLTYAQAQVGDEAWGVLQDAEGHWRATLQQAASQYVDMSFEPEQKKFDLTKIVSGKVVEHLIGGVPAAGLLVFEHPKVQQVVKPITKPLAWLLDRI